MHFGSGHLYETVRTKEGVPYFKTAQDRYLASKYNFKAVFEGSANCKLEEGLPLSVRQVEELRFRTDDTKTRVIIAKTNRGNP